MCKALQNNTEPPPLWPLLSTYLLNQPRKYQPKRKKLWVGLWGYGKKSETSTHLYYVVNGLVVVDLASLPVSDMEHYITKQEQ